MIQDGFFYLFSCADIFLLRDAIKIRGILGTYHLGIFNAGGNMMVETAGFIYLTYRSFDLPLSIVVTCLSG
jgi:hypothetical protein